MGQLLDRLRVVKRAHGDGIAAARFDLLAVRQRLAEAKVDAATRCVSEWANGERKRANEQVVVRGERSSLTSNWGILTILLATSADNGGVEC